MEGAWNPYWGYIGILLGLLGYRSNQPRSSNANMGTTTVATNLAIIRQRKIFRTPGLEPLTTASPLDSEHKALPLSYAAFPKKKA